MQMGPTWFQKARTYDLIQDGLAAGLKLRFTNPSEIVSHRLKAGADMRQRMQMLYELRDRGLAWEGRQGGQQLVARGWQPINAPDRRQWVLHPDLIPIWKNIAEAKGLWTAQSMAGGIFRGWMQVKNVWVPMKLMLSAFHPLHVVHINLSNHWARGITEIGHGNFAKGAKDIWSGLTSLPWTAAQIASLGYIQSPDYKQGREAQQIWERRPSTWTAQETAVMKIIHESGVSVQMPEEMRARAKKALHEAFEEMMRRENLASPLPWKNPVPRVLWHAFRRFMEKFLQGPVFEKWIPSLKAAAVLNEAARVLAADPSLLVDGPNGEPNPRRRAALHAIGKSIDNRFGEMFYSSLPWNPVLKDVAIGSFLSLGWNLGFVREFGGAGLETLTRPARAVGLLRTSSEKQSALDATNKITFALTYFGTAALINAMMSWGLSGNPPDDKLDYVFPRIGGTNPDGSPRRITNMFYNREIPMLKKHIEQHGGDVIAGFGEMLWNKLLFQPFAELWENRDYWGNAIYDENAPRYQRVWQAMKHTLGEQLSPMSITGASRAADLSGQPLPSFREAIANPSRLLEAAQTKGVVLSGLGFGPAPAYAEKSAIQNRIAYLYGEHVAPKRRSFEDDEDKTSTAKFRARTAILIAKQTGDQSRLTAAIEQGRKAGFSNTYMSNIGKEATDVYLFSRLPSKDQRDLLTEASPEERKRYLPKAHRDVRAAADPSWWR
jgi:hypothetical protein